MSGGTLRLILGDQISDGRLSSLRDLDIDRDTVLLAEVRGEATYVRHHKQKITLVFSAMRHFAERLRRDGVRVRYVTIDDPANTHNIASEITRALAENAAPRRGDDRARRMAAAGRVRSVRDAMPGAGGNPR